MDACNVHYSGVKPLGLFYCVLLCYLSCRKLPLGHTARPNRFLPQSRPPPPTIRGLHQSLYLPACLSDKRTIFISTFTFVHAHPEPLHLYAPVLDTEAACLSLNRPSRRTPIRAQAPTGAAPTTLHTPPQPLPNSRTMRPYNNQSR